METATLTPPAPGMRVPDDVLEVIVAPDFKHAPDQDPAARACFQGLPYAQRQRLVRAIERSRSADARHRRVVRVVARLHGLPVDNLRISWGSERSRR